MIKWFLGLFRKKPEPVTAAQRRAWYEATRIRLVIEELEDELAEAIRRKKARALIRYDLAMWQAQLNELERT